MTETHLRTRTHGIGYGVAALCFLLAAIQSLRFGFYGLFFNALLLAGVFVAGIIYTAIMRRQQLKAPGHQYLLALAGLIALLTAVRHDAMALLWLFPLMLLNLMVLPLRRGLILCGALIILAVLLFYARWDYQLATTLTGLLLLTSTAALFAFRYHYNARSVDTLTLTDPETGAYNLRSLQDTLGQEISRSEATGHPLSLVYLSVDYFSELKELHGTVNLQPVLKKISDSLKDSMRAGDSHYHAGEGQFWLLLPFTPEEGVRVIAERVRRQIADSRWPEVGSLTVSLGCTTRAAGETDAGALRLRSQRALDEACRRGHNRAWHLSN